MVTCGVQLEIELNLMLFSENGQRLATELLLLTSSSSLLSLSLSRLTMRMGLMICQEVFAGG